MRILFIILFSVILFSGCGRSAKKSGAPREALPPVELKNWYVKESKGTLQKEQKIGELTYSVTYVPGEIMSLRDAGEHATSEEIRKVKNDYDSLYYFVFEIKSTQSAEVLKLNLENGQQYEERVEYCSFKIQNDIKIQANEDKYIPCTASLFERAYDIAPYIKFVIAFDKKQVDNTPGSDITIVYDDHLFENGPMKFTLDRESINQTPTLRL